MGRLPPISIDRNLGAFYNREVYKDFMKLPLLALAASIVVSGCATSKVKQTANPNFLTDEPNPVLLMEEYEAKKAGDLPKFDIPVVRNANVETWLNYFQGRGRKWFNIWLERSGRYIPYMRQVLREHGLPEDLVYLAMIESGFSPRAYSRASAVGHWQFMKATGRMYNLKVDFWVDERRDPEKATVAAARHLKDLYDRFQDWKLAAAAYNAGQGKIARAIRRYKTEDFWELTKGRYLANETKNYVPKLIAAAMIAKNPEAYGFVNIQYKKPFSFEKVILRKPVNLRTLSKKSGVALEELRYLNAELNHEVTPPNRKQYELKVPTGSSDVVLAAYGSMKPEEFFQYAQHRVRRGDTISEIARAYGVPQREIFSLNKIRSARSLRPGQVLLLPVPEGTKIREVQRRSPAPVRQASLKAGEYRVRRGDTLWDIAQAAGVSVGDLRRHNGLRSSQIRVGQVLSIPGSSSANAVKAAVPQQSASLSGSFYHTVRRGDTLWSISQQYGVSIGEIKNENRLRRNTIHPGKKLRIPQKSS